MKLKPMGDWYRKQVGTRKRVKMGNQGRPRNLNTFRMDLEPL